MIDILIAEDQELVRQGLKLMIETDKEMRVIGQASNGQEAVEICQTHHFDLVILDIHMPIMNGLQAARLIREQWPELIILILTTFNDEEYVLEALKNQANGYLLKDGNAEELIRSIHSALDGGLAIEDHVAAKMIPRLMQQQTEMPEVDTSLTQRELDIITRIGEGMNNQEIASELFLSVGTIKNLISGILTKLDLRDRTQIAIYALKHDVKR